MDKENIVKWVKFVSFGFLMLGGLNWLFIGLFDADIIGFMLGGQDSVASRVLFSIVGVSAVTLLTIVLVKAFRGEKQAPKKKVASKTQEA